MEIESSIQFYSKPSVSGEPNGSFMYYFDNKLILLIKQIFMLSY